MNAEEKVAEARAKNWPRLTVDDIEIRNEELKEPAVHEALVAHLAHFAHTEGECPSCTRSLNFTFQWGLVHGNGTCGICGWPCTLYHFLNVEGREERVRFVVLLPAHPDEVGPREGVSA